MSARLGKLMDRQEDFLRLLTASLLGGRLPATEDRLLSLNGLGSNTRSLRNIDEANPSF